jgi:hypothetical protein
MPTQASSLNGITYLPTRAMDLLGGYFKCSTEARRSRRRVAIELTFHQAG